MIKSPFTLNLLEVSRDDNARVGGKAANLGHMIKSGINVPSGFAVTVRGYHELMDQAGIADRMERLLEEIDYHNPAAIENASSQIQGIVRAANLPPDLIEAVKRAYLDLGEGRVAVRSSATAEDLPDASFAGQYDTYLNVEGIDDLAECLRMCYSSLWTGRAVSYRHRQDIPHHGVSLAVIVQSMVPAKSAGVMFTQSPTSEDESELMIESNFGLGETVVDGTAVPDRFVISRGTKKGKGIFSVVSKEIGTKNLIAEALPSRSGIELSTVPNELSEASSLDDEEVISLAKIGMEIESLFGTPQDIEWAIDKSGKTHILQSRPITTSVLQEKSDKEQTMWTRGYADDYWNDNVTPLFFDLLGDHVKYIVNMELNQIMGYKKMPDDVLKLFRAHAYFNLGVIKNKVTNEIPHFVRSEDVLNYFPEGAGPYGKETMKELPFALKDRILAEIRVMLFDPDGSINKTADAYDQWSEEVFAPYCAQFDAEFAELSETGDLQSLMILAMKLDRVMIRHFRMIRYAIPVHNLGMNLISNYLLRTFLGEEDAAEYYPILISGLKHKTSETNSALNSLAMRARALPKVTRIILDNDSKDVIDALRSSSDGDVRSFHAEFDCFIDDFGARGFTREPYYSRWHEAPELVVDLLKPLVSEEGRDLRESELETERRRREAEEEAENRIKSQRFGGLKWALVSTILGFARRYIAFREDQRFNLDKWITRNRALFLEIGRGLTSQGILTEPSRVFFLHKKELRSLIIGSPSKEAVFRLSALSEERYEEFLRYEDVTPPKFLIGSREYNDPLPTKDDDSILKGIPASQGTVTGRVRVLKSIEEIPLVRTGEVLVVPRTDPGWTPVFSKIEGLITETGGILSHGAVVSREYGIPAVTNIRNACQTMETGSIVTVNGSDGTIRIHAAEE